jgi:nucleotide-binding universal stress UspA family protein
MPDTPAPSDAPSSASAPEPKPRGFRAILLAAELRKGDEPIAPKAWDVLRDLGSHVTVCHVVMRPTSVAGNDTDGSPANPEETEMVRLLRAQAVRELGARGQDVPIKILHGDAGQRICEYAEYAGCDLIVLGPRSRASLAKALRGSVSKYVAANATRDVLILVS